MSDYNFDVGVLRGKMADELANNEEQFVFVLSNALSNVDMVYALDMAQLGDEADPEAVVKNLRLLADAIEKEEIT